MEVNFFGTVNCVELVLPLLRAASRPHLVVVASQATAAPFPRAEAYGASKAALQYFCDCLRLDLSSENIDVGVVNPGFVDTPLTRKNDFEMPFLMDVEEAAGRVINKLESRPRRYSFPLRLSLLLGLSKLVPALWHKAVAPGKNGSTAPPRS
jgi:short-subunit dehydrogenase